MKRATHRSLAWLTLAGLSLSAAAAEDIQPYLTGEMAELELLETAASLASHVITYPDGTEHALEEKKGKVLLVNLWAKWCVPCRTEMKDLSKLQADLGDDRFEVVVLPMKKRSTRATRQILTRWGAENLEPYVQDPDALARVLHEQGLSEDNKVAFALPTTYLVGKDSDILAIREGFLNWDTPEARALIAALKEAPILRPAPSSP